MKKSEKVRVKFRKNYGKERNISGKIAVRIMKSQVLSRRKNNIYIGVKHV